MAEQMEPAEQRRSLDQPLKAGQQPGQDRHTDKAAARNFVVPSEVFGPFGPLPDFPGEAPAAGPQSAPSAGPQFVPPGPHGWPATSTGGPQFSSVSSLTPGQPYPPAQAHANISPPIPGAGTHDMAEKRPYAPDARVAPTSQARVRTKRTLLFPLTRHVPMPLQISSMLLYSLVMVLSIMGCILTLLRAYVLNASVYLNVDGSTNGLSLLVTSVLALLLVPACSLFCGVFFGGWRGLLVSALAVGGGLLVTHVTDYRFGNLNASPLIYLLPAALPLAALVTGLIYDHRQYAAWWKSLLTMFLGTADLVISFLASFYALAAPDANFEAAVTNTTPQSYLLTLAISLGSV